MKLCPACGHEWHLGRACCGALRVVPTTPGQEGLLCSCNCDDSKATKADEGKARFDLIPPLAMLELAEVYEYGTRKYEEDSWRNVKAAKYEAALHRHLNAWKRGEEFDKESGKRHLAHALWNVVAISELTRKP